MPLRPIPGRAADASGAMATTRSGWDAAFYEDAGGGKPVKEFLDGLEAIDPDSTETIYTKFRLFGDRGWEESVKCELLKHVRGKIWELKVKGGQPRVLGFGWHKLFIAAAAEIKKRDDLDPNTIEAAERRREDWFERHSGPGK